MDDVIIYSTRKESEREKTLSRFFWIIFQILQRPFNFDSETQKSFPHLTIALTRGQLSSTQTLKH